MSIKIHSTNDNNHNNVILDKYCFNIIIISVRNISSIEKRYDNETTGNRCSSFLLNSNKIRSLPLTRFQTSLPRGTATTLIKFFHWNIHGGAKWSPAPHLPFAFRLYVYIYIYPFPHFFLLLVYHERPPLLFLPVTTPSSLARRLISAACTPANDKDALLCTSPTRCPLSNNPPPPCCGGKQ